MLTAAAMQGLSESAVRSCAGQAGTAAFPGLTTTTDAAASAAGKQPVPCRCRPNA